MALQAWQPVTTAQSHELQRRGGLLMRSSSDSGGEAMSGAITIPELVPFGPAISRFKLFIMLQKDAGTTTGATANTGIGCNVWLDPTSPSPTSIGWRESLRLFSGAQGTMATVYGTAEWDSASPWIGQWCQDGGGNYPDNLDQFVLTGNVVKYTWAVASLTGTCKLLALYSLVLPVND